MFSWADLQANDRKQIEKVAKKLNNSYHKLQGIKGALESHKRQAFTKAELAGIEQIIDAVIAEINAADLIYKEKREFVQSANELKDACAELQDPANYPADVPTTNVRLTLLANISELSEVIAEKVKKDKEKAQKLKKEFSLADFTNNPLFYTGRYAASTVFNENVSYYVGPVLSSLFIAGIAQAWLASPFLGAPVPIQAASGALNGASGLLGYFTGLGGQFVELVSGNPIVAKLLQVPYAGPALQSGASFVTGTLGSVAGLATHGLSAMATATNLIWYVGVPYACLRVVSTFFEVLEQAKKLIAPAFKGITDSISIISSGISGIFSAFKMGASFISSAFSGLKSLWDMTRTPRNYASVVLEELGPSSSTVKAAAALPGAAAAKVWSYTGQPVLNAGKGAMVHAYKAYQNGFNAAVVPVPTSPTSAQKLKI